MTSADGEAFIVVFPWGKEEELTSGTSFHALASGFGEFSEAIFLEDDEGEAFVEGGTHDGFLARRDGGGDKDGTLVGESEEVEGLSLDLLGCEAT